MILLGRSAKSLTSWGHCIKVTLLSGSREHYGNIHNFSWVSGL